jgi:type II restriction enzyme
MDLRLDTKLAKAYSSGSQITRVLTENWVEQNSYCPNCGENNIDKYENNKPVADFYCEKCKEEYELKGKIGSLGKKINDGAYSPMIKRITSDSNPSFFFLTYSKINWTVNNFIIIPKHFFVPGIIIKRKPLPQTAKRSGWVGCNIDLQRIPALGRIFLIRDSKILNKKEVLENWDRTVFLRDKTGETKGWTLDILNCLDKIPDKTFTLKDIYGFEEELKKKYPQNNFIKDKIRQQLQILRDKGILEFSGKGSYKKR